MLTLDPSTFGALPGLGMQGLIEVLLQFLAVSLRIGAFLIASPLFGARMVPLQVRIVATIAIAAFVFARIEPPEASMLTDLRVVGIVAQELAIGLAGGLVLTIVFSAASLAGEKIAATSGLSFAAQFDPNAGGQTPVLSQIFMLTLTMVFLALNGHLVAIGLVIESYRIIPIGSGVPLLPLAGAGVEAAGTMFALAATIMLPLVAILFMINIAIGIVTKSAPTLNLFSFGFPITLIAAFVLLFLAARPLGEAFADLTDTGLGSLRAMLGDPNGG
jgi:flagellar biosynthetic protein FliR